MPERHGEPGHVEAGKTRTTPRERVIALRVTTVDERPRGDVDELVVVRLRQRECVERAALGPEHTNRHDHIFAGSAAKTEAMGARREASVLDRRGAEVYRRPGRPHGPVGPHGFGPHLDARGVHSDGQLPGAVKPIGVPAGRVVPPEATFPADYIEPIAQVLRPLVSCAVKGGEGGVRLRVIRVAAPHEEQGVFRVGPQPSGPQAATRRERFESPHVLSICRPVAARHHSVERFGIGLEALRDHLFTDREDEPSKGLTQTTP